MTPVLWLAIAVLTFVAMLFMLVPVLRYKQGAMMVPLESRRQKNREVFEQRQLELEQEVADGLIAREDMQQLKTEAQRAFMRDMEALEKDSGTSVRMPAGKLIPLLFVLLVPVLSLLIYQHWGASQDLALPELLNRISASETAEEQTMLFTELADELQARFERKPDDLQSAFMLGTLYEELERYDDAVAVFTRMVNQLESGLDKATVLGQLARSQYQRDKSTLTPAVQSTIDEALQLNPNEISIMAILANDAFQRDDMAAALGYWRRQLSSATPGSRDATALRQVISMVEASMPEQAQQTPAAVSGATITVTINIDPALADQLGDKQSLFIYVRNPEVRPPLVAQNLAIPDFPFTITLDNAMSMTGMTLESAPTLIVGARVSASGNAIAQSGDLQTVTEPFVLADLQGPVILTIDQLVP